MSENVGLVHDNVNEYTVCIDNNVNENVAVDQPQNNILQAYLPL